MVQLKKVAGALASSEAVRLNTLCAEIEKRGNA
jgi:HPt (histidine-containing phosphotransfer) domain-containing protein